ncbi:MAG: hypothetical protein NT099_05625 [Candidatus Saganbacteria bacterium]|nr:hypothetical protein [Candidatus Saganbacteria bacterium]
MVKSHQVDGYATRRVVLKRVRSVEVQVTLNAISHCGEMSHIGMPDPKRMQEEALRGYRVAKEKGGGRTCNSL